MHLDTHQKIAIGLFGFTVVYLFSRHDLHHALEQSLLLLVLLLMIIFYRIIAYYAGYGFPEIFAKDRGSYHPEPYAWLFWILYALALLMIFFDLRIL